MSKDGKVPYDELDPPIVALVRAIHELPGITTWGSCGGGEGHMAEADQWWVTLTPEKKKSRPTKTGWFSLEFLCWAIRDVGWEGRHVRIVPSAKPPFLNNPGHMLFFQLEGHRGENGGIEPDEVAGRLNEMRLEYFTLD